MLITSVVFLLFLLGLAFAMQGFVGKEINPEGQPFRMPIDLEHPGMTHPRERHRVRLVLIGVGLMVAAVRLGVLLM